MRPFSPAPFSALSSIAADPRVGGHAPLAALTALVALTAVAAMAGCSDSAGAPVVPDASRIYVLASDAAVDLETLGERSGDKFSDLYRDLVNVDTGSAKCQTPSCHGAAPGQLGLIMGSTKDAMYAALTTYIPPDFGPNVLVAPQPGGGDASAKSSLLLVVGNGGTPPQYMPKLLTDHSNRKLSDAQLARVASWLKRGAPND